MFSAPSSLPFVAKKVVQIGVRCDPDWKSGVERAAADEHRKTSDFIRVVIDAWLQGQRPEKGLDAADQQDLAWMRLMRAQAPRALAAAMRQVEQSRHRDTVQAALLAVEDLARDTIAAAARKSARSAKRQRRSRGAGDGGTEQ